MPTYQFHPGLLTKPVDITIAGTAPSITQLTTNAKPGGDSLVIETENISLTGGSTINFASIGPGVTFSAAESSEIEILPTAAALMPEVTAGFDLASQLTPVLAFPDTNGQHYGLLKWGYNLDASVSGSMALSAGANVSFSADGSTLGYFAVVRLIEDGPGCDDIVKDLILSWRLPIQVKDIGDIPPGTWIIAEVGGAANFSVNATYGYNLNWIKNVTAGTLTGDIGLKVQVGLAANLGFQFSGKHAVVVSRGMADAANQLRVQFYRLRVRGWDVGFSASATAQAVDDLLPANFDDLIAGIFGVTGTKIVSALEDVDQWTDPSKPLFGPLADVTEQYASDFIKSVTGFDPNTQFPAIKTKLQSFITDWNNLPQQTTKLLWSLIPNSAALKSIADLASKVSTAKGDDLSTLISGVLGNVPFLESDAGKWLESLASKDLFNALTATGELGQIQRSAAFVSKILDGSEVQSLLTNLHDQISKRLDLSQLEKIVDQASVANLDQWLAAKLQAFVGAAGPLTAQKLIEIRDQIHKFAAMRNTFYAKALEAIGKQYSFSFSADYQNTATTSAVVDAVFDFSKDAADAKACLAQVLAGNFVSLMGEPHPGVTLNNALVTHGVRRQATVELSLPYFSASEKDVNAVLSSIQDLDQGQGRLLAVTDTNTITIVSGRNQRDSALTVALNLKAAGHTGVIIHEQPTASCSYSLTDTFDQLSRAGLTARYQPEIQTYFPGQFDPAPNHGTFADWAKFIGDAGVGKGKVSLELTLPPAAILGWMKAPADQKAPVYKTVANTLIRKYRDLLLQQYFADVTHYDNVGVGSANFTLLAYASTPIANKIHMNSGSLALQQDNTAKELYWDYLDPATREAVLRDAATVQVLQAKLAAIRAFLTAEGNGNTGFYADDQVNQMIGDAVNDTRVTSLFATESILVDDVRNAGMKLGAFLQSGGSEADVHNELENFSVKLTKAFQNDLKTWITGSLLLPFGPMLLIEASKVFSQTAQLPPNAILTVEGANLPAPVPLTMINAPVGQGAISPLAVHGAGS